MAKKKAVSAHKSSGAALPEGLSIRRYEDGDWDEVCKLFWKGYCVGNDSAMQIGLRNLHLQPISVVAYYFFATGIAILYFQPSRLTEYIDPTICGAIICFTAAAWAIYWRWKLRKSVWETCKAAWREDMKDISKHYAFEKSKSQDDRGVSGFWVAESEEKDGKKVLVGCVGLDSRTQDDKSLSEVRRLTVSPVERYRRKGIGKALVDQVVSYAREQKKKQEKNGWKVPLRKLVLSTTTYQPAAWELFRAAGWKEVEKVSVSSFVRKIYDYRMEFEL